MMRLIKLLLLCATILFLASCSREPQTGPVEVKWDRDTCTRCSMALSDRNYAVQVRGGPKNQVFKFDDIGCAVHWLKDQAWTNEASAEIWVIDFHNGKWIDARAAHYISGKRTPMGYGFGATAEVLPGSMGFEDARKQLLAKDK